MSILGVEGPPLRVLVVDDDEVDRELVRRLLAKANIAAIVTEATDPMVALAQLRRSTFDVVVLDHHFPRHDGLFLLRELRELGSRVPVIALTGTDESALAVELMKNGAVDFMPKVGLTAHRLALGVRHAQRIAVSELAKGALEEALRSCEELNRQLLETSTDCIKTIDSDGRILSMSAAGLRALEIENAAQLRQQSWFEFWEEPHRSEARAGVEMAMAGGTARFTGRCLTRTGKSTWWSVVLTPLRGANGRPERVLAISRALEPT